MEAIWQWGINFIHTIQLMRGPALDLIFKGITLMGDEEFFLIFIPLMFWCVDQAKGRRLIFAFLFSAYTNIGLKSLFAQPRPFELDPTVKLHEIEGYGLPSGHSQSAVVVWGVVAASFRKTWLWLVAILLMALIGLSRVYLGVHFPTDVLGGWMVGALVLMLYLSLAPRVEAWLKKAGLAARLALAVALPLTLLLLCPVGNALKAMGAMMGMGAGLVLFERAVPFSSPVESSWQRGARFLIGMIGLFALYLGLKLIFPGRGEQFYSAMRFLRYTLIGLWVALGAPWLFQKLRL